MGSVFHLLCPGYDDSKQVTAATANKAMRPLTFNLNWLLSGPTPKVPIRMVYNHLFPKM